MGLRRWLCAQLSRGAPPELDPTEPVEVTIVRLADGPMTVSALEAAGLHAVALDTWSPITELRHVRIMVPRAEADGALEILADLGII
jgi:hypothetical protein